MNIPNNIGYCPFCSEPVPGNVPFDGGIWSGSDASQATNGPLLLKKCARCGTKLFATPTSDELAAGTVAWKEEGERYPGEEFVAIIDPDNKPRYLNRIEDLVAYLKNLGFETRCPDDTFAGILVPSAQADKARRHLATVRIEYLRVWTSDADGHPLAYIGA